MNGTPDAKLKFPFLEGSSKEKQYYIKPSEKRRQKINKVKSRIKYQKLKENSTKKH